MITHVLWCSITTSQFNLQRLRMPIDRNNMSERSESHRSMTCQTIKILRIVIIIIILSVSSGVFVWRYPVSLWETDGKRLIMKYPQLFGSSQANLPLCLFSSPCSPPCSRAADATTCCSYQGPCWFCRLLYFEISTIGWGKAVKHVAVVRALLSFPCLLPHSSIYKVQWWHSLSMHCIYSRRSPCLVSVSVGFIIS